MKKISLFMAGVLLLAGLGGSLPAEIFKNTAGGVSIWLPDGWEIDSDEQESALYADALDGDAFCVLQVLVEKNDLGAALNTYRDALTEEMDSFTVTQEARQSQVNGMGASLIRGEGLRDEKTWSVDVLLIASGQGVLMCALGWEKDKEDQFAFLRDKIFPSIKKLE